jgi:chromosome segregation ATPase
VIPAASLTLLYDELTTEVTTPTPGQGMTAVPTSTLDDLSAQARDMVEELRAVRARDRAQLEAAEVDRKNLNETAAQARETAAAAVARAEAAEAELVRERERVEQLATELAQARQRRGLFRRRG